MTKINHQEFIELYEKGLNDTEIAKVLNVNNATVTFHRQKKALKKNFEYKHSINIEELIPLYEQGLSSAKIGKILHVSRKCVWYYRDKLKLGKCYKPISLSLFQRSVLIGTLLGDGHLRIDNLNAWGDFAHCIAQKEYAINKYEILKDLCTPPKEEFPLDKRNLRVFPRIHVRFLSHPYLTSLHHILYKDKIKIISPEIMEEFNDISLAYLYMDDGTKSECGYYICTNGFDIDSVKLLSTTLFEKFAIESTINKSNMLYIPARSKLRFKELVSPYIIESMKYKL
jgi:DNA-binding CsgD family transcriptional regulator